MRGLGTLVNALAVLAGGGLGLLLRAGLKETLQTILMQASGLAVIFIGISGALAEMLTVQDGALGTQGTLLLVCSLALGGLLGQWLDLEARLERLGERLKRLAVRSEDARFVDGFVSATLVICIGAMAVVGALQDGLRGDHSTLFVKALLDFIIVMVLASSLGVGTLFSALPLALYQGLITLCAVVIRPYLREELISGLCLVGSVLIFAVGINLTFGKRLKVGNFLPALLPPIVYGLLRQLF